MGVGVGVGVGVGANMKVVHIEYVPRGYMQG